jgi:hypothetical protein
MTRKLDDDLKAYLASDPVPGYRERLDTITESRKAQPWYRRAWAWMVDAHKLVTFFTAVCAATIAAHAYIAGLITKDNLKSEVKQAVTEAMLDTRTRVIQLEDNTAELPQWRKATQEMITRHDERVRLIDARQEKLEARFDRYLRR